jgi:hypothetical protein
MNARKNARMQMLVFAEVAASNWMRRITGTGHEHCQMCINHVGAGCNPNSLKSISLKPTGAGYPYDTCNVRELLRQVTRTFSSRALKPSLAEHRIQTSTLLHVLVIAGESCSALR